MKIVLETEEVCVEHVYSEERFIVTYADTDREFLVDVQTDPGEYSLYRITNMDNDKALVEGSRLFNTIKDKVSHVLE